MTSAPLNWINHQLAPEADRSASQSRDFLTKRGVPSIRAWSQFATLD
jgi:hypothetical protein